MQHGHKSADLSEPRIDGHRNGAQQLDVEPVARLQEFELTGETPSRGTPASHQAELPLDTEPVDVPLQRVGLRRRQGAAV